MFKKIICVICLFSVLFVAGIKAENDYQDMLDELIELTGSYNEENIDRISELLSKLDEEDYNDFLTASMMDEGMNAQEIFAKLQLQMAANVKDNTQKYVAEIYNIQNDIDQAEKYKEQLVSDRDNKTEYIDNEIISFMSDRGMDCPDTDFDYAINLLELYINNKSIEIQDKMVYVQDSLSTYNSLVSELGNMNLNATISGSGTGLTISAASGGFLAGALAMFVLMKNKKNGIR
ncbi:MAG: hypothetical protein ACI4WM_01495 [Erysipelotrichaceae bacterium]